MKNNWAKRFLSLALCFLVCLVATAGLAVTAYADYISPAEKLQDAINAAAEETNLEKKTVPVAQHVLISGRLTIPAGVTLVLSDSITISDPGKVYLNGTLLVEKNAKVTVQSGGRLQGSVGCEIKNSGEIMNYGLVNNCVITGSGNFYHFWSNALVVPQPACANYYMQWFTVKAGDKPVYFSDLTITCPQSPYKTALNASVFGIALPANGSAVNITFGAKNYAPATISYPAVTGASAKADINANGVDAAHTITLVPQAPAQPNNVITYDRGTRSSSSGGGGGGGAAYRGGGNTGTLSPIASAAGPVERTAALAQADKALANAAAGSTVTIALTGDSITKALMDELKAKAAAKGVYLKIKVNVSENGKTVAQLSFYPAEAAKNVNLGLAMQSDRAVKREAFFNKHFNNKVAVASLGQQGNFGLTMHVAAKLDLTGLNTESLRFYSYDKSQNNYFRIETQYRIDKHGYLQFDTNLAGDIIVTDKALSPK